MKLLYANDRAGAYPPSYYAASSDLLDEQPRLEGATRADICVVGAGFTGLSAALHLAQMGYQVIVLEAQRIGFGASGRNGGQVGSGQRIEQADLERGLGHIRAHALWQIGEDAKNLVRQMITKQGLGARHGLRWHSGIAHMASTPRELAHIRANAELLARDYGYDQIEEMPQGLIGSPKSLGGDLDRGAGHIHPLKFTLGLADAALAAGARIYERSEVIRLEKGAQPKVFTHEGHVDCTHIILAANGYLGDLEPEIAARVMPINNFILATEPLPETLARELIAEPVAVCDSKFVVNYWRLSEDNRLLFGGGESYGWRFPDLLKTVRKPMLSIYPQLKDTRIDYTWGGTLAITMSRLPYLSQADGQLWSASGYSGHGVAMATLAGKLIAHAINGDRAGYEALASLPSQRFPGGSLMRWPLLVTAMTWFSLRDRLGF